MTDSDLASPLVPCAAGGSGKSTLARALYRHFLDSGTFADRNAGQIELVDAAIQARDLEDCVKELVAACQGRLTGRKLLLLLDNAWHQKLLQDVMAFLHGSEGPAEGSVIIVTSRELDILYGALTKPNNSRPHLKEVTGLGKEAAGKLFSAYTCSVPWEAATPEQLRCLEDQQAQLLEECRCHPLTIITLACYVNGCYSLQNPDDIPFVTACVWRVGAYIR